MSAKHPDIGARRIDVDELVDAYERSAEDPDAPLTVRQRGLLTAAIGGCQIGLANASNFDLQLPSCGPVLITVTPDTLERIHSC